MSDKVEHQVEIVEVGLRDGFQGIAGFIPTARKIEFLQGLYDAGARRLEITSFVSPKSVPQLADAADILEAAKALAGLRYQVLVPTERYGYQALEAGANFLAFVLSVSPAHNMNNVRRSPAESANEYLRLMASTGSDVDVRLNIATAFDCSFDGRISSDQVIELLDRLVPAREGAEICLCDTTGRATSDQVKRLTERVMRRYPSVKRWALHSHDTYGQGLANCFAAYETGMRVFDSAFAGLGGCPFAPGATGNTATEDLVWTFEQMSLRTGFDLPKLIRIAEAGAKIPGAVSGGRVRNALGSGGSPQV